MRAQPVRQLIQRERRRGSRKRCAHLCPIKSAIPEVCRPRAYTYTYRESAARQRYTRGIRKRARRSVCLRSAPLAVFPRGMRSRGAAVRNVFFFYFLLRLDWVWILQVCGCWRDCVWVCCIRCSV